MGWGHNPRQHKAEQPDYIKPEWRSLCVGESTGESDSYSKHLRTLELLPAQRNFLSVRNGFAGLDHWLEPIASQQQVWTVRFLSRSIRFTLWVAEHRHVRL